jgi:UDP-N-acetylmuramoyl-L-alanyl-D-glutamate--2,6-diaminopimelate ligase
MQLQHLLQDLDISHLHGDTDRQVRALAYHSNEVIEGSLFVAIPGTETDGHDYVKQAIDRGATTVVVERPLQPIAGATILVVTNTRAALASLASRFYGFPSRDLSVIGITGTNGKTTTAYMLESILAASGGQVGVIGTVNIRYPGFEKQATITTPESLDLQRILREMLDVGVTHVVLEVSSHGLDLHRVDNTSFTVGLFTNLSQDHLDFHGSMENYFAAKSLLFSQILQNHEATAALAVINADDLWGQRLCAGVSGPLLRYGLTAAADIRAEKVQCDFSGIRALLQTPKGELEVQSPLLGRLNLYNLLAAAAVAVGLDLPLDAVATGMEGLIWVPGRLERIPTDLGFHVLVDYAHTPDALEKALGSLRELQFKRTICVFGCGGDRDRDKRPLMGEAAARTADLVVITSDNPRSEVPEHILEDIETGIRPLGYPKLSPPLEWGLDSEQGYIVVVDRREAIRLAISLACEGDVVYIGGKGHENHQILGSKRIDFDDRLVAAEALAERTREKAAGCKQ